MNALQSLERLTLTADFRKLALINPKESGFNLIKMLDATITENAWSRVLAFLFDGRSEHGLGSLPLERWCHIFNCRRDVTDLIGKGSHVTPIAEVEWGTSEKRRLDILIRLSDDKGKLRGVIGIENKVRADESEDQLGHYQRALASEFPQIPKLLVFLTPTGRLPVTADLSEKMCPVDAVDYATLRQLFQQLPREQSVTEDLARLLRSLSEYVCKEIIKPMEETKSITSVRF